VLFGTPAEEGGGGKIKLLDAGAYSDLKCDINLISHPGPAKDAALVRTTAYASFKVEFFGKEAHAAAAPWDGINALDAMVIGYSGLSVLRQQTMPGDIIQGYITDGGIAPNIIHAYVAGIFVARALTKTRLAVLKKKVEKCFEAGAEATGATLKLTPLMGYGKPLILSVNFHRS
jgi:metal-dependent amidase/aminoacylase/carboxypeptidase family protein